jgi:membrane protease YdiL (CAAX protease family)
MNKPRIALLTALLYTTVTGLGMWLMKRSTGFSYGQPEMIYTMWWVEIILSAITIFVTLRYFNWHEVGFHKLNPLQLLWLLPSALILGTMLVQFFNTLTKAQLSTSQWQLVVLIAFTTFLVGFSEELLFRGIVLHAFLKNKGVYLAMLVSALAFSLLHAVNVFGGVPVPSMLVQLVMTFLFGFFFAPLMLRLNNLIPLIVFHWLWDFVLIAGSVVAANYPLSPLLILLNIVLGSILWFRLARAQPKPIAS